jgi:hypothetical protein
VTFRTIATTLIIVILFFGLSFYLIWRFDPGRIWDHFARSLVQGALAISTVLVAIVIFQQQLEQHDAQNLQQQQLAVAAQMRSSILQLANRAKLVDAYDPPFWCDVSTRVCRSYAIFGEHEIAARVREHLDGLVDDNSRLVRFHFALPVDQGEYWQLVRANPLVSEKFFEGYLENLDNYSSDVKADHESMLEILNEYKKEKTNHDADLVPRETLLSYAAELARLQVSEGHSVTAFVCYLLDRTKELQSKPHKALGFDKENTLCPPHSETFEERIGRIDFKRWTMQTFVDEEQKKKKPPATP